MARAPAGPPSVPGSGVRSPAPAAPGEGGRPPVEVQRLRVEPSRLLSSAPPVLTGSGAFVPRDTLTNAEVARLLDGPRLAAFVAGNVWCARRAAEPGAPASAAGLYAEFVAERLGVHDRHVVDREAILARRPSTAGVRASDLGAEAARRALAAAGRTPDDLDLIVVGTSSPDSLCPWTAVRLQALLGASRAFAFDVQAACSSFVFALAAARALVLAGSASRALVVSAETFTHGVDWRDPATAGFFGDGAGAAVLERADLAAGRGGTAVLDVACWSAYSENIRTAFGGPSTLADAPPPGPGAARNGHPVDAPPGGDPRYFWQDGPVVFRDLVPVVDDVLNGLLARHGLAHADLDLALLHQASGVMVDAVERRVLRGPRPGLAVPRNLERYGNTSSAGAALLLAEAPPLAPGRHGVVLTFGGGYAVGAALLRGLPPSGA